MNKRGQVTLYVIIALVVLAAIIAFIYFQGGIVPISAEIKPVQSFVESCIKGTAGDALIFIGQQGGYYNLPQNSVDDYVYYFYNNKSYAPSRETIETQLSLYMDEMLPFCTGNFSDFPNLRIEANPKSVKTRATIVKDKVRIDITYDIIVGKGKETQRLEKFSAEIPSRLFTVYKAIQNIIAEQLKDPGNICLSCLTNLAAANDLYINVGDYSNSTVIFTITDNKTLIKNAPYEFVFANKYQT
jgi:hypothetical protein